MSHFKINKKDVFFILKEQLNYGSLASLDRYAGLNEKTFDMLITEALKFAKGVVDPLQEIGEEYGVKFEGGKVNCPPEFKNKELRMNERSDIRPMSLFSCDPAL